MLCVQEHSREEAVHVELWLPARVLAGLGRAWGWTSGEQPFAWPRNGVRACASLCH